jgi:hypothetical protein
MRVYTKHNHDTEHHDAVRNTKVENLLQQGIKIGSIAAAVDGCIRFHSTVMEDVNDFEILRRGCTALCLFLYLCVRVRVRVSESESEFESESE